MYGVHQMDVGLTLPEAFYLAKAWELGMVYRIDSEHYVTIVRPKSMPLAAAWRKLRFEGS